MKMQMKPNKCAEIIAEAEGFAGTKALFQNSCLEMIKAENLKPKKHYTLVGTIIKGSKRLGSLRS
jgi:hypothetical protein